MFEVLAELDVFGLQESFLFIPTIVVIDGIQLVWCYWSGFMANTMAAQGWAFAYWSQLKFYIECSPRGSPLILCFYKK